MAISSIMRVSLLNAVVVRPVRWWITRIQSASPDVGMLHRIAATILVLPPFCVLYACLRIRAAFAGPLVVDSVTPRGHLIRCRLPDLVQSYIHLFGVWEPDLTEFLERRLKQGDVFIDVGANVGHFTLVAASRIGHAGAIVAIEASPDICADLKRTIAVNGADRLVSVINEAASDRVEEATLFSGPAQNLGLTSTVEHRGMRKRGSIQARPLSDMIGAKTAEKVRLIKIDVEGGEDRVLHGLIPMLPDLPFEVEILVEVSQQWWESPARSLAEVLGPFLRAGFHLYSIENNYWPWRYLWPRDVSRPRRLRDVPSGDAARLDLVLSRIDADEL